MPKKSSYPGTKKRGVSAAARKRKAGGLSGRQFGKTVSSAAKKRRR
ncbi:hypothetical protein LCGC14_0879490 [marine sediment metagenome]|uniref:Uncharacterized protein n=1 Tax=marine sediment metagenome TaxID=412755 RepID=A0A0F9PN02_9ZZZZ